ncbi:MAG: chromosomal replication initiator protein DnaA [Oscillospiraceae bacterium]|nr:chromosomal replication initiator protein DnaA [Oscillospiraceae bacterium]
MKKNLDITEVARKSWIDPIKPLKMNGNTAFLYVQAAFVKQIIQENYIHIFKKHFKDILGFEVDIKVQCDEDLSPEQRLVINPIPELEDDKLIVERLTQSLESSNYQHTFDTFIEGASNQLAYAACKAVAGGQKQNNYNPLYIYGNSGLGKTHLLSAVKNEINKNNPELDIKLVPADNFINDFVNSIRIDNMADFKNKYRGADALLVDDVQLFSRAKESQHELFNIFNELHGNGKQIILTSDRPPKEINNLDQRLKTRFESGLIADIAVPEFETRLAIIQRKAKLMNLEMSNTIAEFIAEKLKNNIRQLEGAIIKMNALSVVTGITPTMTMARNVVEEIIDDEKNIPAPLTVERVINEVASIYGISEDDIRSKKRSADISTARQIAIYVVHKITKLSYVEIGKEFGNRDHSTIVYAINKVKDIIVKDKGYRDTIEDTIRNVENL